VRVCELYYSIADLSTLLRFAEKTLRAKIKAGDFSPPGANGEPDLGNILEISGELRVPASGVNHFLDRHRLVYDVGVKARNLGELRRKLGKVQTSGLKEGESNG
jgi:hypothetical protein